MSKIFFLFFVTFYFKKPQIFTPSEKHNTCDSLKAFTCHLDFHLKSHQFSSSSSKKEASQSQISRFSVRSRPIQGKSSAVINCQTRVCLRTLPKSHCWSCCVRKWHRPEKQKSALPFFPRIYTLFMAVCVCIVVGRNREQCADTKYTGARWMGRSASQLKCELFSWVFNVTRERRSSQALNIFILLWLHTVCQETSSSTTFLFLVVCLCFFFGAVPVRIDGK